MKGDSVVIQRIKGTHDILSPSVESWVALETMARDLFTRFGFREIRPPLMEWTELFARGIGESTDIVEKEMYSFTDSRGRSISLRPEATAGVLRAFIENKLYSELLPQKLFTIGPMFRHERPQKGRFRQFHQINVEVLGDPGPQVDAELIAMAHLLCSQAGVTPTTFLINSLGCPECRPRYREALSGFFSKHEGELCPDCSRRLRTNPLRVLDCKAPACRELAGNAPRTLDHLCPGCVDHLSGLEKALDLLAVPYRIHSSLVRGLDYYARTAFELVTTHLGAQDAVMGGGRYDGLVELLGGPSIPGIGFAAGMERLHLLIGDFVQPSVPDLMIVTLSTPAQERAIPLCHGLRSRGFFVEMNFEARSLKSHMKRADRTGARFVLILGDDELRAGNAVLRNMRTKNQESVDLARPLEQIVSLFRAEQEMSKPC